MTDEDLKKIREIVKDEVRPVKDMVEMVKHKVDHADLPQMVAAENVRALREQVSILNEKVDTMQGNVDKIKDVQKNQLLPSVVTIEQTIKAYGDMYKLNNDNMKKLEKRIDVLEDDAGIEAPEELILAEVQ